MRETVPFLVLACACGAAARSETGPARGLPGHPLTMDDASRTRVDGAFAPIVARSAAVAPGMREVARRESTGEKVEIIRADRSDVCVRVAFEASSPIVGKLLDASGDVLSTSGDPSTQGVLGPLGPICVRRGDSVSAVADESGARVRWVGWGAP